MPEQEKKEEVIEIGSFIARLHRFHRRFMLARLEPLQLSGAMHSILFLLNNTPGVSQDYIACHYNMDKGIIARQCKALEARNLIRREVNPDDRRQYCLFLTDEGKKIVPFIRQCYGEWAELICKNLTKEEALLANRLMMNMVESCREDMGEF